MCCLQLYKQKTEGWGHFIFQFPHCNPELLQKWVQATQRKDWFPSKHSVIFSTHFTESCFVVRPGKEVGYLKGMPFKVSCISESLTKNVLKQKSPKERLPKEPLKPMSPSKVWKQIETDHPYNTAECSTSQKVKWLTNKVKAQLSEI